MEPQVRRLRNQVLMKEPPGTLWWFAPGVPDLRGGIEQAMALCLQLARESFAPLRIHKLIGQVETRHRIVGVGHDAIILWRNLHPGEPSRQCGATHEYRTADFC